MATRLRTDAAQLRAPRVKDDGTTVFDAVLVYADKPLKYSWGVEIPTEGALSSPAYLESLRGQPVVIGDGVADDSRHPEGDRIDGARDADGRRLEVIGTVVGAQYDSADRCVIVELAVHAPEHVSEVRRLGSLSEGYSAQVEDGRQIARTTNHIAIVQSGRAPGSGVRADAAGVKKMDEELKKFLTDLGASLAELKGMILGKGMGETTEEVKVADADPAMADEAAAKVEQMAEQRADAIVKIRRRADALGIEVPETVKGLAALRKHVAIALGADKSRADSADYAQAVIDLAKVQTEGELFANSGRRADVAINHTDY